MKGTTLTLSMDARQITALSKPHTHMYACMHALTHTHTHTYIHSHTRVHIHAHTHTHIFLGLKGKALKTIVKI